MEQKRPADIFQELLDYLWNGLGLEEKPLIRTVLSFMPGKAAIVAWRCCV